MKTFYKTNLAEDIHSLSDFRAQAASIIDKVKEKRRTVVITQNGAGAAALINLELLEELREFLEGNQQSGAQSNEPEVAYKSSIMDRQLQHKIEQLSEAEQQRLSHLIDTLIAPLNTPAELPVHNLSGKLDKVNIRKEARKGRV